MIVVDTNVISEYGKPHPNLKVVHWLGEQDNRIFLPTIVLAELSFGVERMVDGRRKIGMRRVYAELIAGFEDRILDFDREAAYAYAELQAVSEKKGWKMDTHDAQIAAIAKIHGAAVATRNTKDFESIGLTIINPWEE